MKLRALYTTALCAACLASFASGQNPVPYGYSAARPAPAAQKPQPKLTPARQQDVRVASRPASSGAPVARVAQASHPAAGNGPMPAYQPMPDASFSGAPMAHDGGYMPSSPCCGGDYCGPACGGMTHPFRHCLCCKGTGDLAQHYPYCAEGKGYYYFRPYHVMHVFAQQEMVTRWGGDPRNPYENSIFQRIDQQYQNFDYRHPGGVQPEYVVPHGAYPNY